MERAEPNQPSPILYVIINNTVRPANINTTPTMSSNVFIDSSIVTIEKISFQLRKLELTQM